jgi:hypothetical protein
MVENRRAGDEVNRFILKGQVLGGRLVDRGIGSLLEV